MNKVRFLFAVVCAAFILVGRQAQAQTTIQYMSFYLVGNYQTNIVTTNADGTQTNSHLYTPQFLVNGVNLVKALAVDAVGTKWTNWAGAYLLREVNLINGHEGIYLRIDGVQTNVSQYFQDSYSNNFTYGLTNAFPAVTNFDAVTNSVTLTNGDIVTTNTNLIPDPEINRGWLYQGSVTNGTNFGAHYGLHYISFHTSNLQFNLIGTSYGLRTPVAQRIDGTLYEQDILSETITSSGLFLLNTTTNIYGQGENPQIFVGGPIHGTLHIGPPILTSIEGPQ
jgi:hypothetical protein